MKISIPRQIHRLPNVNKPMDKPMDKPFVDIPDCGFGGGAKPSSKTSEKPPVMDIPDCGWGGGDDVKSPSSVSSKPPIMDIPDCGFDPNAPDTALEELMGHVKKAKDGLQREIKRGVDKTPKGPVGETIRKGARKVAREVNDIMNGTKRGTPGIFEGK